jgi:murein DD-endopeptidase MepM/ murein hydrolase activator NlpD
MQRAHAALERRFPERRLFLKSEDHTRFIRLRPGTQLLIWSGAAATVGWTILATAMVLMGSIGAGNYRDQAMRDRSVYEDRLEALAAERDQRALEAAATQDRFAAALRQVSVMQGELLGSERARAELEAGLATVQATLRDAMAAREVARAELAALATAQSEVPAVDAGEMAEALDFATLALASTAAERDQLSTEAETATRLASDLDLELRLMEERNDEIFQQLEAALEVSVEPLDEMFETVGLDPDEMIEDVRRGYTGQGGPLTPIQFSTSNVGGDDGTSRANGILDELDRLNLYRIALEQVPFAMPVSDSFRWTSGFGPRWGRMHEGVDMAGPVGTPIYATADGVVVEAGWASGYGRLIKIRHEFGIETRYAHLNAIRVEVGQRVSRGDRIGDMGNSGRSTGPHLHYEIRVGGEALNPMIYLGAADDVL